MPEAIAQETLCLPVQLEMKIDSSKAQHLSTIISDPRLDALHVHWPRRTKMEASRKIREIKEIIKGLTTETEEQQFIP